MFKAYQKTIGMLALACEQTLSQILHEEMIKIARNTNSDFLAIIIIIRKKSFCQNTFIDLSRMQMVVNLIVFFHVTDLVCCRPYFFKNQSTYLQRRQTIFKGLFKNSLFILEDLFILHLNILLLACLLLQTVDGWLVVFSFSNHILAKIARLFLPISPRVSLHIVKVNISTRIACVASDSIGVKHTIMNSNILHCYISHGHSRLGLAHSFTKRIKHATRTISIRFFHLLRTNINTPPDWSVHCEVLKVQIFNYACTLMSGIGFHINAFYWSYHPPIFGCDISNAISTS